MSIISRSLKSINIYKSTLKSILGKAKYFLVVYKYFYSYKYTCTLKCFQVHLFLTSSILIAIKNWTRETVRKTVLAYGDLGDATPLHTS